MGRTNRNRGRQSEFVKASPFLSGSYCCSCGGGGGNATFEAMAALPRMHSGSSIDHYVHGLRIGRRRFCPRPVSTWRTGDSLMRDRLMAVDYDGAPLLWA